MMLVGMKLLLISMAINRKDYIMFTQDFNTWVRQTYPGGLARTEEALARSAWDAGRKSGLDWGAHMERHSAAMQFDATGNPHRS
jgi:hypothetical protein